MGCGHDARRTRPNPPWHSLVDQIDRQYHGWLSHGWNPSEYSFLTTYSTLPVCARVVCSLLSGRPIRIDEIRPFPTTTDYQEEVQVCAREVQGTAGSSRKVLYLGYGVALHTCSQGTSRSPPPHRIHFPRRVAAVTGRLNRGCGEILFRGLSGPHFKPAHSRRYVAGFVRWESWGTKQRSCVSSTS